MLNAIYAIKPLATIRWGKKDQAAPPPSPRPLPAWTPVARLNPDDLRTIGISPRNTLAQVARQVGRIIERDIEWKPDGMVRFVDKVRKEVDEVVFAYKQHQLYHRQEPFHKNGELVTEIGDAALALHDLCDGLGIDYETAKKQALHKQIQRVIEYNRRLKIYQADLRGRGLEQGPFKWRSAKGADKEERWKLTQKIDDGHGKIEKKVLRQPTGQSVAIVPSEVRRKIWRDVKSDLKAQQSLSV